MLFSSIYGFLLEHKFNDKYIKEIKLFFKFFYIPAKSASESIPCRRHRKHLEVLCSYKAQPNGHAMKKIKKPLFNNNLLNYYCVRRYKSRKMNSGYYFNYSLCRDILPPLLHCSLNVFKWKRH